MIPYVFYEYGYEKQKNQLLYVQTFLPYLGQKVFERVQGDGF
jgi:hypothetical protein